MLWKSTLFAPHNVRCVNNGWVMCERQRERKALCTYSVLLANYFLWEEKENTLRKDIVFSHSLSRHTQGEHTKSTEYDYRASRRRKTKDISRNSIVLQRRMLKIVSPAHGLRNKVQAVDGKRKTFKFPLIVKNTQYKWSISCGVWTQPSVWLLHLSIRILYKYTFLQNSIIFRVY